MSTSPRSPGAAEGAHDAARRFRAFARHPVRLDVLVRSARGEKEEHATVVDISIAGAGLELDGALAPGERLVVAFSAPTMWDPLLVEGIVAWSQPVRPAAEHDRAGRPRAGARAGLAFDYASPDATLAMFEMLSALGYE